jgi:hypothetical protein
MAQHFFRLALLAFISLPAGAATSGPGSVEAVAVGSVEEMLVQAKQTVAFVQDSSRRSKKIRDQAEKEGDNKLVDCITGPYSSLNTLQAVATDRYEELAALASEGDTANSARVFRSLVILRDKATALAAQAEACTADGQLQEGSSLVNANQDGVSNGDETDPLLSSDESDIDPPPTSPFQ